MLSPPSITPGKSSIATDDIPIFIQRLYNLLEDGPHDIVNWADDGQSFLIHFPSKFAAQVLPIYYSHRKMQTFLRMLNFYGFHRCQSKKVEFSHLTFQRGNFKGLTQIRRRFKQDLDDEDREIVEDIEETILCITRQLEQERRMDAYVMQEYLKCLVDTPPPLTILDSPPTADQCHSPCATPRATIASSCATPAFKRISLGFEFPS